MGEVKDVDPAAKPVILADGGVFPYDYLIVAAGSQTSYYGHDGWQEWAPGLHMPLGVSLGRSATTPHASSMLKSHRDRKSTRLNSSHIVQSRMPSSA